LLSETQLQARLIHSWNRKKQLFRLITNVFLGNGAFSVTLKHVEIIKEHKNQIEPIKMSHFEAHLITVLSEAFIEGIRMLRCTTLANVMRSLCLSSVKLTRMHFQLLKDI